MVTSLKSLKPKNEALRLIWADFKGVKFQVRYMSKATMLHLVEQCKVTGYNAERKGRNTTLDAEKLNRLLATTIVVNWNGATPRKLTALYPLNVDSLSPEELDAPVEFNEENLLEVIEQSHDLDTWLQEVSTNPENFRPEGLDSALKNSSSSQSGT